MHVQTLRLSGGLATLLMALLSFTAVEAGGSPDLTLGVTSTSGPVGGNFNVQVVFDNTGTSLVDGWSYGVCIGDPLVVDSLATCSALTSPPQPAGNQDPAVCGGLNGGAGSQAVTGTVNGGFNAGFASQAAISGQGWTQGIVIDLFGVNKLAPGLGYVFAELIGTGLSEGSSTLTPCNTIGTPPVSDVIVIGGNSVAPTTFSGTVTIQAVPPFSYHAATNSPVVEYNPDDGVADGVAVVTFGIKQDPVFGAVDTQGFSMDCACDGAILTPTDICGLNTLLAIGLNAGGCGPEFFTPNLTPLNGTGWTLGVVYALMGGVFLQFPTSGAPLNVVQVTYSVDASTLLGVETMDTQSPLTWVETLGEPPVTNRMVVAGTSNDVAEVDGFVTLHPVLDLPFVRGDCNDDGGVNIADGIFTIQQFLVAPIGPDPAAICLEACDGNGDGLVDISDAIYNFNYQLQPGSPGTTSTPGTGVCATPCPAPPAPFPNCGVIPGASCGAFAGCP